MARSLPERSVVNRAWIWPYTNISLHGVSVYMYITWVFVCNVWSGSDTSKCYDQKMCSSLAGVFLFDTHKAIAHVSCWSKSTVYKGIIGFHTEGGCPGIPPASPPQNSQRLILNINCYGRSKYKFTYTWYNLSLVHVVRVLYNNFSP